MDFKEALTKYKQKVEDELTRNLRKEQCPEKSLYESMEYSLMAGGKRLRPILILQTYRMFAENEEICMPFAVAMEMVHTFSLIHDDLPAIDNDDYRRGRLTNHKKFNESTAILAGDSLFNNAYMVISQDLKKTTNQDELIRKITALDEFSKATDRMIAGEYVDTEFEGTEISDQYLEYMHQNKTGALLKACIRIGAILAGARQEDINKLTQYAEKIGLTFQIKDDILNEIGDANVIGKPVGNDKEMGKVTYVTKYGLKKAQNMLEAITNEAVAIAETYEQRGEFLKELAIYIKERNK